MAASTALWQVQFQYTLDTKKCVNVFNYVQDVGDLIAFDPTTAWNTWGALLVARWTSKICPSLSSAVSLNVVTLSEYDVLALLPTIPPAPVGTPQKLKAVIFRGFPYVTGLPVVGSVAGDFLPTFNALRLQKTSGLSGRRKQGHTSIAGVPESATTADYLVGGALATWQANGPAFVTATNVVVVGANTYNMNPVIYSPTSARLIGVVGSPASIGTIPITGAVANSKVGTFRRRKLKTGAR